jgi:hypothetical protein
VGYLFTHMITSDYGRLYYSLSRDGLHFTRINGGKRINEDYRGHTAVTRGHDGRYYMTGGGNPITLWVSPDLVKWEKLAEYAPSMKSISKLAAGPNNSSAAKIFFDQASRQYILTWQTAQVARTPSFKGVEERYWGSHRAVYSLSRDLKSFSEPKLLFPQYDVAAIDIIMYAAGRRYFAVFKDEQYPTFDHPQGKSIRIASGSSLTGPFGKPGPSASPSFREAPSVVPRLDGKGWYLYFEQYPGEGYEVATAASLDGPWFNVYIRETTIAPDTRHGFVMPLTREQWNAIIAAYGEK